MSLRLVRCPYCGKRFNISGIVPGTRLRCGFCTAILTVPQLESLARPARRKSAYFQIGAGIAAGLVAAVALFYVLRPAGVIPPPVVATSEAEPAETVIVRDKEEIGTVTPEPRPRDPVQIETENVIAEFGGNYIFYTDLKPYVIALERSHLQAGTPLIREYGRRMDVLSKSFKQEFGDRLGLTDTDKVLPVIVFNSRMSFDRYFEERNGRRMADSIKGIYEYDRRRIVLYHSDDRPFEVVMHEGIHQVFHHHTLRALEGRKAPSTYWFQEGLAAYFEGFHEQGNKIVSRPAAESDRLPILKQTLLQKGLKDFVSLPQLVGMSVDDFWKWFEQGMRNDPELTRRRAQLYYAESWALVQFLRARGGEHLKVLDEYFVAEMEGRTLHTAPKEIFEDLVQKHLGKELAHLEDEFVNYILNLR